MKNNTMRIFFTLLLAAVMLGGCGSMAGKANTVFEIESSGNNDSQVPFISEKTIYVSENTDVLDLDISFQMKGGSGTLEIVKSETEEIFWRDSWDGEVKKMKFTLSLEGLRKEEEYIIRFTGTQISHVKIIITTEDSLVRHKEKPLK